MQHIARGLQCEPRLIHLALLRDHADLGAVVGGDGGALELAHAEEQQVGGHLRRGLEGDARAPVGTRHGGGHRHVAHCHLPGRCVDDQIEGGLEIGFVPGRHEAARIRILELGEQRAAGALRGGVIQCEQARGLRADRAAVVQREQILARRQRGASGDAGGLRVGIGGDLGRHRGAACRGQRGLAQAQIRRLQHDGIGRRQYLEIDTDLAIEAHRLGMRGDLDGVMAGPGGAWQLGGDGRWRLRGRRRCCSVDIAGQGGTGQGQHDGGRQEKTHG